MPYGRSYGRRRTARYSSSRRYHGRQRYGRITGRRSYPRRNYRYTPRRNRGTTRWPRRGNIGRGSSYFGNKSIARSAKATISKKKSETYTIDVDATIAPAVYLGSFHAVVAVTPAQDMSLAGFSRAPIIQNPAIGLDAYGTTRQGEAWNEVFHKWQICVRNAVDDVGAPAPATCNRVIILEVIDQNKNMRTAPNTYLWNDFLKTPDITSFWATKRDFQDTGRSMTRYRVIRDKTFIMSPVTGPSRMNMEFQAPKHTVTVADETQNYVKNPHLRIGSKRYLLFLASDATGVNPNYAPVFTGNVRMKYQDP